MGIINDFLRLDEDIKLYIINNFSEAHVSVDENLIITINIKGDNSFESFTEQEFREKYILKDLIMNVTLRSEEINNNRKSLDEKFLLLKKTQCIFANKGSFALMKSGEIIQYFDTEKDGFNAGRLAYPDGIFSVHRIDY